MKRIKYVFKMYPGMNKKCRELFIIQFLLHSSIYAVNNFFLQILKNTQVCNEREYALLQLLLFIKFIGIMIFTNLAEKKHNHRIIIAINMFLISIGLFSLIFAKKIENLIMRKIVVIFSIMLYNFCSSGTFSLLDSLCYNVVTSEGLHDSHYGKIRIGGSLGNMSIHFLCYSVHLLVEKRYPNDINKIKDNVNIILGVIFAIICGFSCIFRAPKYTHLHIDSIMAKEHISKFRIRKVFSDIYSIISPLLIFYSLALLSQGIDRATLTLYLTTYLEERGLNRSLIHLSFFFRYIPEIVIYSFSAKVEKFFGLDFMFFIAAMISTSRTLFFAYEKMDFSKSPFFSKLFIIIQEVSKGFYSSFLNYSCLRIFKLLATKEKLSIAQGIYTAVYNALSSVFFAPLGYFIVNDNDNQSVECYKTLFTIVGFLSLLSSFVPLCAIFNSKWRNKQKSNS